jgi:hypothetical protein
MSVTIRAYRRGGWEADVRLRLPDGRRLAMAGVPARSIQELAGHRDLTLWRRGRSRNGTSAARTV